MIPDRIEAATFLAALGVAGGEITLDGARADHMDMLIAEARRDGHAHLARHRRLWAMAPGRLRAVDVSTLPYPGLATDYKPLLVAMLAVADGVGIVTENIFAGRFRYVDELVRMGADIRTEGHHAVVRGVAALSGAPVRAPDIRAGAALVVAGLGPRARRSWPTPTTSTAATSASSTSSGRRRRRRAAPDHAWPASIFGCFLGIDGRALARLLAIQSSNANSRRGISHEQHLVPAALMGQDHDRIVGGMRGNTGSDSVFQFAGRSPMGARSA